MTTAIWRSEEEKNEVQNWHTELGFQMAVKQTEWAEDEDAQYSSHISRKKTINYEMPIPKMSKRVYLCTVLSDLESDIALYKKSRQDKSGAVNARPPTVSVTDNTVNICEGCSNFQGGMNSHSPDAISGV